MSLKNRKNKTNEVDVVNTDNNVSLDNADKNSQKEVQYSDIDEDIKECDKLLEQLDEIENGSNSSAMSSKVRNLIREDKEAIRIMNENIKKSEEDDLDYLEDEKAGDSDIEIEEKEANLDFLANLNRDDRIRKQQPRRLQNNTANHNVLEKIKVFARENTRNFWAGTAIAFLFLLLIIALIVDAGNNNDVKKDDKKYVTEFLNIDTTPMVTAINNYYAALANGEKDVVKSLLADKESVTDEEVEEKCEEAKAYSELVGNSFLITDCYVQQGVKKNEYIAYMKFQLQIKNIETPSVGIFTCYFVDKSTKDKVDFRISTDVNDKTSEVYRYIIKMSNCSNVTEIFDKADKELEEACAKDPDLKAIVDALVKGE